MLVIIPFPFLTLARLHLKAHVDKTHSLCSKSQDFCIPLLTRVTASSPNVFPIQIVAVDNVLLFTSLSILHAEFS